VVVHEKVPRFPATAARSHVELQLGRGRFGYRQEVGQSDHRHLVERLRPKAIGDAWSTGLNPRIQSFALDSAAADARITRPIADLGSFMTRTLENRAPDLLPVFEDWQRRFEARDVKPVDSNAKTTRVRRPRAK